jgi:hypothetical protein
MSKLFGSVRQLGFVVTDIEAAMAWWLRSAQIGPWFYLDNAVVSHVTTRGTVTPDLKLSAAFANTGDLQIELIEQRCDTPSIYTRPGDDGGRLHHLSSWPEPTAYDQVKARAAEEGFIVDMEAGGKRGAFAYFSKEGEDGPFFEIAAMLPWRKAFFDQVRAAAVDWNGTDPIRDWQGRRV